MTALLKRVRELYPEKDVWCYTGYTYDTDLLRWIQEGKKDVRLLLSLIDVLVDGEFIAARKNLRIPFRGSENQRIIDVQASLRQKETVLVKEYIL